MKTVMGTGRSIKLSMAKNERGEGRLSYRSLVRSHASTSHAAYAFGTLRFPLRRTGLANLASNLSVDSATAEMFVHDNVYHLLLRKLG